MHSHAHHAAVLPALTVMPQLTANRQAGMAGHVAELGFVRHIVATDSAQVS
jgi:hypothetical protein